jgi:serine/threonine-protein kinase
VPLAPHADIILDMAGLFPFFLQVACSHCIECAKEHPDISLDFDDIRKRFDLEARLHYRFLWDKFDASERSVIQRVTSGRKIPDALRHVVQDLEARSYLQPAAGRRRLFSTSFQRFVESEVLPGTGASRLRLWVERLRP